MIPIEVARPIAYALMGLFALFGWFVVHEVVKGWLRGRWYLGVFLGWTGFMVWTTLAVVH